MKQHTAYRILTFVLLPIEALFAIMTLIMLMISLSNPAAFLPVFLMACTVIYTVCSFLFLIKGIDGAKPCSKKLKDWLKVNAYVSFAFSALCIGQSVTLMASPTILHESVTQAMSMQPSAFPKEITPEAMVNAMKGVLIFILCYFSAFIIHILSTFRLLKQYNHVFDSE